jgi:class 3 adenylate cyclase
MQLFGAFQSMDDFELPITRYVASRDVNIAYQTMGEGPVDLILAPGIISHVEFLHEFPGYTSALRGLATFSRVITFDKRGQGLSDRVSGAPSLEERMDDVRAIMDEIGSRRAVLMGFSEGAAMSVLFAATYPERVSHLILFGGLTYPVLSRESSLKAVKYWGAGRLASAFDPREATNPDFVKQVAKFERLSASPGAIKAYFELLLTIDVRSILSSVRVPTLVLHNRTDPLISVDRGRELARQIPNAKYIEYPEGAHAINSGNIEAMVGDVKEFITGERESQTLDGERVLATVVFTDIVESTRSAAEMGDERWRRLLDSHDEMARQLVRRHRGSLIKSTGDGILATFDGPGRAIRCALAFGSATKQIGLQSRAGVHTGEIELRGRDIGGIAVHVAARVMAHCAPNEVLVSRVVTDLVAGAGLKFADRGSQELKGLPGRWDLFAASS